MKTKSWVFTMRLPEGKTQESLESKVIEKCQHVTSKSAFIRECIYAGYILSELGLMDLLVTEYRKCGFESGAKIDQLSHFIRLIGGYNTTDNMVTTEVLERKHSQWDSIGV